MNDNNLIMLKTKIQTEKILKKAKSNYRNKITKTKIILDSDTEKDLESDEDNDENCGLVTGYLNGTDLYG